MFLCYRATGVNLDSTTKFDIVYNKLSEGAWTFAHSKRAAILADAAKPDKVAALMSLLAEQYDPADKYYDAVQKLVTVSQGSTPIQKFNDSFNLLSIDLPTGRDELLKQIYICQLHEKLRGHARAHNHRDPNINLATLQGYISSFADTQVQSPQTCSRPNGRNSTSADNSNSTFVHEGQLLLKLGRLKPHDGWTPTAEEFRKPTSEVPKLTKIALETPRK